MFALALAVLSQVVSPSAESKHPAHFLGDSKGVATQMSSALQHLEKKQIVIQSEDDSAKICEAGHAIYERQPTVEWAYDGKILTLKDLKTKSFYRGPVKRFRILEAVPLATGQRLNPFTRSLLLRRTPLAEALEDSTVKVMGSIAVNGVPCKILKATTSTSQVTFYLRSSDGLPVGTTSETLIGNKPVPGITKSYSYSQVKEVIKSLALPKGFVLKPLPPLPERKL